MCLQHIKHGISLIKRVIRAINQCHNVQNNMHVIETVFAAGNKLLHQ